MNYDEINNKFALLTKSFNELFEEVRSTVDTLLKYEKNPCDCEKREVKKEVIKDFSECSVGEKFIITMLESGYINGDDPETIINQAERLLLENKVIEFLFMYSKEFRDSMNELLNSLYSVDLSKLRMKHK